MLDQPLAGGEDALPSFRRAGLDDEQHIGGQRPEIVDQLAAPVGRQFAQDIGKADEIA